MLGSTFAINIDSEHIVDPNMFKWKEFSEIWTIGRQSREQEILKDYNVNINNSNETERLYLLAKSKGKRLASEILGKPTYMTMTSISHRLHGVGTTVESIIYGKLWPDHIYIFISEEGFLLDQGISTDVLMSNTTAQLRSVFKEYPHISIIYTDNFGPHRKLLPLLAKKWNEDCFIITIDDHELYPPTLLSSLVTYSQAVNHNAVVARRSRRLGICSSNPPWKLCPYTSHKKKGLWPEAKPGRMEMLLLPTGMGGVLYKPHFFHPIVFDKKMINTTVTGDDLLFRLGTMIRGVSVVTACSEDDKKWSCPNENTLPKLFHDQFIRALGAMQLIFPTNVRPSIARYLYSNSMQNRYSNSNNALIGVNNADLNSFDSNSNSSSSREKKKRRQGSGDRDHKKKNRYGYGDASTSISISTSSIDNNDNEERKLHVHHHYARSQWCSRLQKVQRDLLLSRLRTV